MKGGRGEALNLRIRKRFEVASDFELDVAAEITPGITIIFGPSGAGKTTLLECIAGLLTPNSGCIAIGDRTLFDHSQGIDVEVRKRKIGYVFQDLALFPHLTIEKNVGYGVQSLPAEVKEAKIAKLMDSFRISALRKRKPREISGGERQRAALARALITNPCVLLLDEPLAAIDAVTKANIIEDLRGWNDDRNIPILYVTHSREEVSALGGQAIVLEAGKSVPAESVVRLLVK